MISNGISKLDLKRRNRMQILRLLRRNGPTSRIDIAREIGITKAAVTIITNEMIQDGILYEKGEQRTPEARATRGRKKILLDICATYKMDMGIVLEGQNLYAGVSTLWGEVVEKQTVPVAIGASREEIVTQMEDLYRQLIYKNDLKPEQITGLGICISPRFFDTLHIKRCVQPDYSDFEKYIQKFVHVPFLFGTLSEGAAIAEVDYWQHKTVPADDIMLIRCAETLEGAVIIGQELYRGASGRVLHIPEPDRSAVEKALWEKAGEVFSAERTPNLWRLTDGNIGRLRYILREGRTFECDKPIQDLLEEFVRARASNIPLAAELYDPGKILLFAAHPGEKWIAETIRKLLVEQLPGYTVELCRLEERCLFLAGAALATREFFGNRGGY